MVLLYATKTTRNSMIALLGCLEQKGIDAELIEDEKELLKKSKNEIICISIPSVEFLKVSKLAKKIRKRAKLLIAGGPHPTADPKSVLRAGFDIAVIGEGEETLPELILNEYWKDVKGIAYLDKEIVINNKRKFINLDDYPPFAIKHKKFGPIEITRGCPFGCYFCQTWCIFGKAYRHRSVNKVLKWAKSMFEYGLKDIRFISPNAFAYGAKKKPNTNKIEKLLKGVKDIGFRIFFGSFPSEVRPEHITEELLEMLKQYVSNNIIIIGAQSGSRRILEICNRGHDVKDVYNAVDVALKVGFKPHVDFIFGLPEERKEDRKRSLKVIKNIIKSGAKPHIHFFMPLPGTVFAEKEPAWLDIETKKQINKMISNGFAYGNWINQEKLAKALLKMRGTGFEPA